MKVELLAHTQFDGPTLANIRSHAPRIAEDWVSTDADLLAEFSGRSCYQSFHKPNPKTADNEAYIKNILNQGHYSVLEHSSATFYVTGVSRALTHELIRHRHLSYSELSQRFVDIETVDTVIPPALRENTSNHLIADVMDVAEQGYQMLVDNLTENGFTRKQAREAARAVMPNATETRIVVTGNMRAWRDMLHKRYSVHADAEIREFAAEILRQLREIAPGTFQDFPEVPFE